MMTSRHLFSSSYERFTHNRPKIYTEPLTPNRARESPTFALPEMCENQKKSGQSYTVLSLSVPVAASVGPDGGHVCICRSSSLAVRFNDTPSRCPRASVTACSARRQRQSYTIVVSSSRASIGVDLCELGPCRPKTVRIILA